MAEGEGTLEASMLKAYVCRAAEWVTREGRADPRRHGVCGGVRRQSLLRRRPVLSIFEGADETLALKVVARRLVEQAG